MKSLSHSHRQSRRKARRANSRPVKNFQNRAHAARPVAAYRRRSVGGKNQSGDFYAQEDWHEPIGRDETEYVIQPPGKGYIHPATIKEVRQRIAQLPERFTRDLEVVQFSRMTKKRALFPCYGMQWGLNVYLYPIEESLVETYVRAPTPEQLVEAKMYGARWTQDGHLWRLNWTPQALKDFYLNNVLIHEIGHVNDTRNTNFDARERYANWFAIEYGYRRSRGRN